MALLVQSSRKLPFLRAEVFTVWKLFSQNNCWQECLVTIECRCG
jgi:hypothetical protein